MRVPELARRHRRPNEKGRRESHPLMSRNHVGETLARATFRASAVIRARRRDSLGARGSR
jgi:hypothetical protein